MTFHIITIFPELFGPYLNESVLGRGIKTGKVKVKIYDLRVFAKGKHRKVDDRAYGGGPGMVIRVESLAAALEKVLKGKAPSKTLVVLTAPAGKELSGKLALSWAGKYKHIVLVAGRYEGVDQRVKAVVGSMGFGVREISIGPYVLTGGEIPALVVVDALSRYIPGVLGKRESLEETRHGAGVPVYTRPEVFEFKGRQYRVPKVLLSGNHAKIDKWNKEKAEKR